MIAGLGLALASAVTTSIGFLLKHRGAVLAPAVQARHPLRSAAGLFRSRWFALGWGVAVGAWGLHVGALALAPLSTVHYAVAALIAIECGGSSSASRSPQRSASTGMPIARGPVFTYAGPVDLYGRDPTPSGGRSQGFRDRVGFGGSRLG